MRIPVWLSSLRRGSRGSVKGVSLASSPASGRLGGGGGAGGLTMNTRRQAPDPAMISRLSPSGIAGSV
ncbi:hypothetical protein CF15_05130 [Pyrodictium occultum]|uniref:Uncharacterized protein n=1 Tax=Pyrodictium occultum TaxID=2309 RepID=A0A0V8RVT3_PYROC|nr:hypothetical protein CF15_05130 [Pyrodictium occultum]